MDDIFLNFELLLSYDKLSKCEGKRKNGDYKKIVECVNNNTSEIWWAGLKFIKFKKFGLTYVKVHDTDYSFLTEGKEITNEKYLLRLCKLIKETSGEDLFLNRAKPKFVRRRIVGMWRFNNPIAHKIPQELISEIKADTCGGVSIIELSAKHNLSVSKIRAIKYNRLKHGKI